MSGIDDRRQRAREAWWDAVGVDRDPEQAPMERAVEVATQVKITNDVLIAAVKARREGPDTEGIIKAAFVAAGFEVIE